MTACDSHLHIIAGAPGGGMSLGDYLAVRAAYGTGRVVIVQAKAAGTDNSALAVAVDRFGSNGRGIAVVTPDVNEAELERLHAAGVRGVRFSLWNAADAVVRIDDLFPIARRIAPFGWHLQLHMHADQLVETAELIRRQPCEIVVDHMARLPPEQEAVRHPAFDLLTGLAGEGRAWVKLSGPYLNRRRGPEGREDATRRAREWISTIPDRLVWGSDWPHVTEQPDPPAPGEIGRTLSLWCEEDAKLIQQIGTENPAALYGFEAEE